MLLATTVMLLVLRSPSIVVSVMWLINPKMFVNEKPPFPLRKFHSIANLGATLNAATTFIMFIIYGTTFRSEFTRIYCFMITKMKKSERTETTIEEEQQRFGQMISNNNKSQTEQHISDTQNNSRVSMTNKLRCNFYNNLSQHDGSTTGFIDKQPIVCLLTMKDF